MSGENYVKVAGERNDALDALLAFEEWMDANRRLENTAYKGDARKAADEKREICLQAMAKVRPLLEKRKSDAGRQTAST